MLFELCMFTTSHSSIKQCNTRITNKRIGKTADFKNLSEGALSSNHRR